MSKKHISPAAELFDKYASAYETKYMDVSKYHPSLDLFCQSLNKKDADILEVACGPGNITNYILSQNPSLNVQATDLSPAMLKIAAKNNPQAKCQLLDCRNILEMKSTYDGIICGFGLPYLSKEEAKQFIFDAASLLNEKGLLYLSTMEDDYSKSGYKSPSSNPNEGLHMYFHETQYLAEYMGDAGFYLEELSRIEYTDDKGEEVTDLILIGKKDFNLFI